MRVNGNSYRDELLPKDGVLYPLLWGMTQTFRWQYIPFHTHIARLVFFGGKKKWGLGVPVWRRRDESWSLSP